MYISLGISRQFFSHWIWKYSQPGKTREGDCTQLTEGKSLRNTLKAEKKPASDMCKRFIKKLGQTIRNFDSWTSFLRYSAIHFTYEQLNCKELRLRFSQKKNYFLTYLLSYLSIFCFLIYAKEKVPFLRSSELKY